MSLAIRRLATVTVSVKRSQFSQGKRSTPTLYLTGVWCTPLDPIDSETRERLVLNTPHGLLQTFTAEDYDIRPGDLLVLTDVEYPVKYVARWDAAPTPFLQVIVEALQL